MDRSKKIVILMGRGIEGCGVTRSVMQFKTIYGPNLQVWAASDREWIRQDNDDYSVINRFKCADWSECEKVLSIINESDFVITYSIPAKDEKVHPLEAQQNFLKLLREAKARRIMVHCDHSTKALSDNANVDEIFQTVDLVMAHSKGGAVGRRMDKIGCTTPFDTMGVGFNYDSLRAKYWKPIEEQETKRVRWIGRTAMWKGPNLLIDFHEKKLRSEGYITVLEGLEASIQSPLILYHDGFDKTQPKDVIQRFRGPKAGRIFTYGEETPGNPAYLYPLYNNAECMERLSLSAFGSDLYNLKPEMYGNNIENCHAEPVAVGTVPIFHKHFGDHIIHRRTGDPCTKSTDSGTIWLDGSNYDEAADLIYKLSADNKMRDEWREMSFEFWKAHSDAEVVYTELTEKIALDRGPKQEPGSATDLERFFT